MKSSIYYHQSMSVGTIHKKYLDVKFGAVPAPQHDLLGYWYMVGQLITGGANNT